jgi:hypothetical protein
MRSFVQRRPERALATVHEPGLDVSRPNFERGKTRATIMPQELEEANLL